MTHNQAEQNARIAAILGLLAILLVGVAMLTANMTSMAGDTVRAATNEGRSAGGLSLVGTLQ